ncbi:tRNA pseudouridine synthase A, partial [Candidatus Fermentibacterales bacterium]|nr:tRNA pseudouridine synthase A [Candidatus Fermentibacterales bacterium]
VQGEVERSLSMIMNRPVACTGSGRTDAGVHAWGQVAHVDLLDGEEQRLLEGLGSVLPDDVGVRDPRPAPDGFHARFSACSRLYRYRLSRLRLPLSRRYSHVIPGLEMDDGRLEDACRLTVGRSDWRGLARTGSANRSWDVEVLDAGFSRGPCGGWTFEIRANRFLRGMVRLWVGTLVEIGRGKLEPSHLRRILESGSPEGRGPALPARGLCLVEVSYPAGLFGEGKDV